jgi:hypothetical protein
MKYCDRGRRKQTCVLQRQLTSASPNSVTLKLDLHES